MTPRHHLIVPWLILWTSIFRDFAHFLKSGPGCQGFPSRYRPGVDTIGKSVENHEDRLPETFIWWTWARDILGQRGSRPTKWRMGSWAIWGPTFMKIIRDHPRALRNTPGQLWWILDITWIILGWFYENRFSRFCALFEKWSDVPILPGKIQTWGCYHPKEHRK